MATQLFLVLWVSNPTPTSLLRLKCLGGFGQSGPAPDRLNNTYLRVQAKLEIYNGQTQLSCLVNPQGAAAAKSVIGCRTHSTLRYLREFPRALD